MENEHTDDTNSFGREEISRQAWLGTRAAADYLGCKYGTLKTWRSRGEGPKYYVIHGKMVRYHVDDLDAYVRGESGR